MKSNNKYNASQTPYPFYLKIKKFVNPSVDGEFGGPLGNFYFKNVLEWHQKYLTERNSMEYITPTRFSWMRISTRIFSLYNICVGTSLKFMTSGYI